MRRVAVVGAGMSRFGTRPVPLRELFHEAFREAIGSVDRGLDPRTIEEAWIGSVGVGGAQIGNLAPYLSDQVGLRGIPAHRVENACASSGFAFRNAWLAVSSGRVDLALVGGIEKMNDLAGVHQRYWLGVSGDTLWERVAGLTFPGVYALMARRHFHEYGTTKEDLAAVAVKNRSHGSKNPKAQHTRPTTREEVLSSPIVSSPLGILDCCSTTDGAAALLVAEENLARSLTDTPIWVLGSGGSTDALPLHERSTLTEIPATRRALREALEGTSLSPGKIDIAEVHDCFTIAEILAIEDLGFVPKGEGGKATASGETSFSGHPVVNPSGGLLSKGHPLGATGAAQIVEIFLQLREEAGPRQVPGAEVGLAHNVGGSGASVVVHIFGRSRDG